MKALNWIMRNYHAVTLCVMVLVLFRTCSLNTSVRNCVKAQRETVGRLDAIDSAMVTAGDLRLEGLRAEKRMIQCTDRKLFDLKREKEIDDEIDAILGR